MNPLYQALDFSNDSAYGEYVADRDALDSRETETEDMREHDRPLNRF